MRGATAEQRTEIADFLDAALAAHSCSISDVLAASWNPNRRVLEVVVYDHDENGRRHMTRSLPGRPVGVACIKLDIPLESEPPWASWGERDSH